MWHRLFGLALLVAVLSMPGGLRGDIPVAGKPDPGFSMDIQVEFALENGPVVFRVGLTNRSGEDREYVRDYLGATVRMAAPDGWRLKSEDPHRVYATFTGHGPGTHPLKHGERTTEFVAVQQQYQRIPAGRFDTQFEWPIQGPESRWKCLKKSEGARRAFDWQAHTEPFVGRQVVQILPATAENVEAVRKRLEALVNEAEDKNHLGASWRHPQAIEVVRCLINSRHPEFVPLIVRVLQWERSGFNTQALCDTIYDSYSDPRAGFEPLCRLYKVGRAATAKAILDYWWHQESYYGSQQYVVRLLNDIRAGKRVDPNYMNNPEQYVPAFMSQVTYWNNSRAHPNSRLTPNQHLELQSLDNVWLRAAYWQKFPNYCSPFWATRLYADLKRAVAPPDEKVVRAVCEGIASDRFAVRERASREAMGMDERIVPALSRFSQNHPSAETSARVAAIARHLERQPVSPFGRLVVDLATEGGRIEGVITFHALADKASDAPLAVYTRSRQADQEKQFRGHEAWRVRQRAEEAARRAAGQNN